MVYGWRARTLETCVSVLIWSAVKVKCYYLIVIVRRSRGDTHPCKGAKTRSQYQQAYAINVTSRKSKFDFLIKYHALT